MCRFLYCMCSIQESCGTQCFLKLERVLGSLSAVIVYYKSSLYISACLSGKSVNSSFYSFYWHSDGFPNILWIYLPSPILYFYSIYVCAHTCVCIHVHMHTCIHQQRSCGGQSITMWLLGMELRLSANTVTKSNFGSDKVYFVL